MNKIPNSSEWPSLEVTNFLGESLGNYPLRRIICIGRNYPDHAREMGHDPKIEPPFYFYKPITALASHQGQWSIPGFSSVVHYELELVVALQGSGRNLNARNAKQLVAGFALGLDMTCRDLQQQAKSAGRPWDTAKGFDGSAPCTPLVAGDFADLLRLGSMELHRNNQLVQKGHWHDMQWSLPELLCELSRFTQLGTGDIIFTGTPAGVGSVMPGDTLQAHLDGLVHGIDLTLVADT